MSELLRKASLAVLSTAFAIGSAFGKKKEVNPMQAEKTKGKIYEFEMKTIDGKPKKLSAYKGHPLLVVNTASLCGFTPQYTDLQALHEKFSAKGLRIAAFPANEFGKQEPGTNPQIKEFCKSNYEVSFPLFEKIVVKGDGIHPLYKQLTNTEGYSGDIKWNFAKFLVGKNGEIVARFDPQEKPEGEKVIAAIEKALAN